MCMSSDQIPQYLFNIANISSHSKMNHVEHKIVTRILFRWDSFYESVLDRIFEIHSFLSHFRTLREKTTLAVTSRGRFGTEDEKAPVGTSSRRRLVPRNLATITVGGSESIMVQALRLEELQRAKDEKRWRRKFCLITV